jgi:hypothetical protein
MHQLAYEADIAGIALSWTKFIHNEYCLGNETV